MAALRKSVTLALLAAGTAGAWTWLERAGHAPAAATDDEPELEQAAVERSSGRRPVEIAAPVAELPTPLEAAVAPRAPVPEPDARMWRVDEAERETRFRGEAVFEREWDAESGLGAPHSNASSCVTCHRDPVGGGAGGLEFNVLVNTFSGYYEELFDRSFRFSNARAQRDSMRARGVEIPEGRFSEVQTPSLLGLGAIASIREAEILRREDPDDADGDGIRGIARRVRVGSSEELGRFGWKAAVPRVEDFVRLALGGEQGLSVPPDERRFGMRADGDDVEDPEVSAREVEDLVHFVAHLAPPRRPTALTVEERVGSVVFESIGCTACHAPSLAAEDGTPVALYSDLLLHDIDTEPEAVVERLRTGSRFGSGTPPGFRTPPLWGVGATAPYLSDGSAETLDDAILAHGGEAEASRSAYEEIIAADREALVAFLGSL